MKLTVEDSRALRWWWPSLVEGSLHQMKLSPGPYLRGPKQEALSRSLKLCPLRLPVRPLPPAG